MKDGLTSNLRSGRQEEPCPQTGQVNADLWQQVQDGGLAWHWVPSHKSEEDFVKACGRANLWWRTASDLADYACKRFTATLEVPDITAEAVAKQDTLHRKILDHLACGGKAMLTATAGNQPPVYKAGA